jgi:hypothetical protein
VKAKCLSSAANGWYCTCPGNPHSKPSESTAPPAIELTDIRLWPTDEFGISAERLRNCIRYQLDFADNDWYRTKAPITPSKMKSKKFVTKLNDDTLPGWTPETHGTHKSKSVDTSAPETDEDKDRREYSERVDIIKKFRCSHCNNNGFLCHCPTNAEDVTAFVANYVKEGSDGNQ